MWIFYWISLDTFTISQPCPLILYKLEISFHRIRFWDRGLVLFSNFVPWCDEYDTPDCVGFSFFQGFMGYAEIWAQHSPLFLMVLSVARLRKKSLLNYPIFSSFGDSSDLPLLLRNIMPIYPVWSSRDPMYLDIHLIAILFIRYICLWFIQSFANDVLQRKT